MLRKKKKYDVGGNLLQYSQPIAAAGNLIGNSVEQVAGPSSMGGSITGGVLKGAATGAAFGPWGALIGGAAGGVMGEISAHRAKEADTAQKLERKALADQMFVRNSGNSYKTGGQMKSKLNVVQGGSLNQVSPDAVEVSANNPDKTDSVELDQAFVDHGEIIDRENRVFSDSIFLDGKSIARQAKKLEQMKSKNLRFKDANSLIDNKLDTLYNYQESTKTNEVKESFKKGGTIHIKPENKGKFNATKKKTGKSTEELTHSKNPVTKKRAIFAQNAKKWRHADGGTLDDKLTNLNIFTEGPVNDSLQNMYNKVPNFGTMIPLGGARGEGSLTNSNTSQLLNWKDPFSTKKLSGIRTSMLPTSTEPGSQSLNWSKAGTQLATYGPNLLNSFLQSKLQGPAAPTLETGVKLDRVDPSAQLASNARQAANAGKTVRSGVAQSSDLISATGSLLSKRLAADNQVMGQNQALNAEIQGREAITNQGVRARNAERLTGFSQSKKDFANKKIQNFSDIATNASTKALTQGRENNEIDRDKLALEIIKSQYGDSGVIPRNFEGYLDDYFAKRKGGLKKGGKLYTKKNK